MTENGGVSSVVDVAALPYLAHLISRVAQSPLAVTVAKVPLLTDFFFFFFFSWFVAKLVAAGCLRYAITGVGIFTSNIDNSN